MMSWQDGASHEYVKQPAAGFLHALCVCNLVTVPLEIAAPDIVLKKKWLKNTAEVFRCVVFSILCLL